jgi:hypothetical protein
MARESHEREDLLRDARALVPRIMLRMELGGGAVDVLAGFRGEALSLYFGDDPVVHFNARGELRRAFVDDRLIKAERGRLVELVPDRSIDRTEFQDKPLSQDEVRLFLTELKARLRALTEALAVKGFQVVGEEPKGSEALPRLEQWLAPHGEIRVAQSPRVGG